MTSGPGIWLLFLLIGVGTLGLRYSLIALLGRVEGVPPALERSLRFIPPAVLAAIATPALVHVDGALAAGPRLFAGLIAIVVGLVALWILQAL